jgi:hypothetical protein
MSKGEPIHAFMKSWRQRNEMGANVRSSEPRQSRSQQGDWQRDEMMDSFFSSTAPAQQMPQSQETTTNKWAKEFNKSMNESTNMKEQPMARATRRINAIRGQIIRPVWVDFWVNIPGTNGIRYGIEDSIQYNDISELVRNIRQCGEFTVKETKVRGNDLHKHMNVYVYFDKSITTNPNKLKNLYKCLEKNGIVDIDDPERLIVKDVEKFQP